MMRCTGGNLLALAAALAATLVTAPCRAADELETLRQANRQAMESNFAASPLLGRYKITDVLRFGIDHGRLTLTTNLPATTNNMQGRIEIEGMPGIAMFSLNRRPDIPMPVNMAFSYYDFSDPKAYRIQTQVNFFPAQLNISRTIESPDEVVSINLVQSMNPNPFMPNRAAGGVNLMISRSSRRDGRMLANPVQRIAADLGALRQQYPAETTEYLQPLMRDLGCSGFFTVDALTARQVFADEWKLDAAVVAQINALVAQLDNDAFRQREAASDKLRTILPDALLVLARLDRKALTPEQNASIDVLLAECPPASAEDVTKWRGDTDFLVDCLTCDDLAARQFALQHLNQKLGKNVAFDVNASPEAREARASALRQELLAKSK